VEEGKGVGREAEGRVVEEKRGEGCPQLGSLDPPVKERARRGAWVGGVQAPLFSL